MAKTKNTKSTPSSTRRRKGDEIQLSPKDEKVLSKIWDKMGKRLRKTGKPSLIGLEKKRK